MKFTSISFLGLVASASLTSVAAVRGNTMKTEKQKEDNASTTTSTRRVLKSSSKSPSGSSKSGKGSGGSCATCSEQLPGYSFFGQNYLDEDFWQNLASKALFFSTSDALPSGTAAEFGTDYLIPTPLGNGFPTSGDTCYDNRGNLVFCGLTAALAELLYSNDLFRCILTSVTATARDITCQEKEEEETMRRRLSGGTSKSALGYTTHELILELPKIFGWTKLQDIVKFFGVDLSLLLDFDFDLDAKRRLSPDIRGSGTTAEDVANFFDLDEFLDDVYRNPDNVQALRGSAFIDDCINRRNPIFDSQGPPLAPNPGDGQSLGVCLGLFSLVKALDASVCYYRTELECGEASCTKDLAFDVAYNTERLVLDLPPITTLQGDTLIADVLSPCDACILEKSDGCAAFCPLFESYHTCNNVNAALEQVREDPFGDFLLEGIVDFLPIN